MKWKTGLICLLVATMLLLCCMPAAAAASDDAANTDAEKGFLAWADKLRLANPGNSSKQANPSQPNAAATKLTEDELKTYAERVFELVNKERENAGVTQLERNDALDEAANIRASELVQQDSHTRPNGNNFYSVLDDLGIRRKTSSENIYCEPSTPEEAMRGWMESEIHKIHILKDNFTAIGIGIYQSQDGKLYWVQLFIEEK